MSEEKLVETNALSVLQLLINSHRQELAHDLVKTLHLWRSELVDDSVLKQKTDMVRKKWARQLDVP